MKIEILEQAYKKLKSYLYTDKSLLAEKIGIARFEQNLEVNLKKLLDSIEKEDISKYTKKIDYILVPKKIEKPQKEEIFYTNKTKQDIYIDEARNIFIKAPIEIHIISVLWIMFIGEKLDKDLLENIKGNRLFRNKNDKFLDNSYKLFKPYYEGYQSFRDEAINMAIHLHKKDLDVTVLNIDIQEFYYNIDFDFEIIKDEINPNDYLNDFMKKIHNQYHKKIKDLEPTDDKRKKYNQTKFLPIGLVSSSVIANYILRDFDNDVVQNLKPEYYGRYVDDMLFVFSNASVDLCSKTIVKDLIQYKLKKISIETDIDLEKTQIIINDKNFILQNKKIKLFQFYRDDSISLLEKFKDKIDENSSFFNFMPDDKKLFKTLESSSYNMFYSDSENKISSIIGTTKDTFNISKNLSGILATVSNSKFDNKHLSLYNNQIENVFSGHNIFELKLYWEKVFKYYYLTKNYNDFVKIFVSFYNTIEKLSNIHLRDDVKQYLYNSVLFSIVENPKYFVDNLILEIENNEILISNEINLEDINNIRKSNMFSSHLMVYPLINYMNYYDNEGTIYNNFDFLTHNIDLKGFSFKIDDFKIENSPRYIHYHEIILFYFYRHLNLKRDRKTVNTKSVNTKLINRFYNKYNNLNTKTNDFPENKDNNYIITTNKQENKDKLKIGIVSLKVNLKDIENSYISTPNLSYDRLQSIFDILNKSIEENHKVDLLVFPEVSVPYVWIHLIAKFAKKNNIGIVFGVEHIKIDKRVHNFTCVMLPFNKDGHTNLFINFESKKHFSPNEKISIESRGFDAIENKKKKPTFYNYRGSVFGTMNCYEISDITYRSEFFGKIDFAVIVEYNKDTNYFSNIIDSASRDLHSYIVQVNTSDYGDSRIVQPTKTDKKDIVKLKGGENVYLVVDTIDIKSLREFQKKGHCLQIGDDSFKLVPPNYEISELRK